MADQPSVWGAIIREIRESQGISQRDLCARTGVGRTALRQLEMGLGLCSVEYLEKLLDFLGYDLDALPRPDFYPAKEDRRKKPTKPKKPKKPKNLVDTTVANVVRHHDPFETGDDI